MTVIQEELLEPVEQLLQASCAPFTVSQGTESASPPTTSSNQSDARRHLSDFVLDSRFDLRSLLSSSIWIDDDIPSLASKRDYINSSRVDLSFGPAFDYKYGHLPSRDDARSAATDWEHDLNRALSHVNPKATRGHLLHIGSDSYYEPPPLHTKASSVILVDIAEHLLQLAAKVSPKAKSIQTRAGTLTGIDDTSIDFIVALRVFSSFNFNSMAAIRQAKRTLRNEGSILISVCNGYRAIDDTILPGQIVGTTPYLDFSQPFKEALKLLGLLHKAGFCELFLVPGSTELFLGGTYRPNIHKRRTPILHVEGIDPIPLCFFSESMPTSWLGNYSNHPIQLDGFNWPTVEHFFQAQKFYASNLRQTVLNCTSPQSSKFFAWSQDSEVRDDWNSVRVAVMLKALQAKFEQHPYLQTPLLLTGNRNLIERSQIDHFWGRSLDGQGENMLGNLLMELRLHYRTGGKK